MVIEAADLERKLDALLAESVESAKLRQHTTFDQEIAPFGHRIVLSGAGNLGRKVLRALRINGIHPLAFVDNDSRLWGSSIDGVKVYSPQDGARLFGQTATFCVTIWRGEGIDTMAERFQPLLDFGCANVIHFGSLFWKFHETLLPHYSLDLPHKVLLAADKVRSAFALWHDDASRAEYVAQISWRLHLDFDNLPLPVPQKIYFSEDLYRVIDDEVFVDCGAFDGDTIRDFLVENGGRFKRIYAFEADARNFDKLTGYVAGLPANLKERVVSIGKALGERAGTLRFSATGTAAAAISSEGVEVESVALDRELLERATCIKMDIEGSEPAALRGARETIARSCPVLCVCVYHSQDHVWSIPLQIAESSAGYRMYLRPHLRESWDLVCYAIPGHRVLP